MKTILQPNGPFIVNGLHVSFLSNILSDCQALVKPQRAYSNNRSMLLDLMELSGTPSYSKFLTALGTAVLAMKCMMYLQSLLNYDQLLVLVASTLTAAVLRRELGLIAVKVVQFSWLSESSSFIEAFEGHVLLGPSQLHD